MMHKVKKLLLVIAGLLVLTQAGNAQKTLDDNDYKFSIFLTSDWTKTKEEETSKKNAISYSFNNIDQENSLMIMAFKVNGVKDIDDLIYNVEKDVNLDIPSKSGDYNYNDYGDYDRKEALYKDNEVVETVYYFTTKNDGTQNYAYVVRFITLSSAYNNTVAKEIDEIIKTFKIE